MGRSVKYTNWKPFQAFIEDDSTTDFFEDDEAFLDGNAATKVFYADMSRCYVLHVTNVSHYINPTNAVTYTMYILTNNEEVAIDEAQDLIYQSDALMADSVLYIETGGTSDKLPIQKRLDGANTLFAKFDWTAAPGDTSGFVLVEGLVLV